VHQKKTKKGFSIKKETKKRRVPNIPFTWDAGRQRDSYALFAVQLWLLIEWVMDGWNHESEPAEGLHHQRGSFFFLSFLHGNMEWMQTSTSTMAKSYPIINPTKR